LSQSMSPLGASKQEDNNNNKWIDKNPTMIEPD
jgi:hypothetical protein